MSGVSRKERLIGDGAEERESPEPWSLVHLVRSLDFVLGTELWGFQEQTCHDLVMF